MKILKENNIVSILLGPIYIGKYWNTFVDKKHLCIFKQKKVFKNDFFITFLTFLFRKFYPQTFWRRIIYRDYFLTRAKRKIVTNFKSYCYKSFCKNIFKKILWIHTKVVLTRLSIYLFLNKAWGPPIFLLT